MWQKIAIVTCTSMLFAQQSFAVVVPGSVPPVTVTTSELYADDTRGIAVPEHEQFRLQSDGELFNKANTLSDGVTFSDANGNDITPVGAGANPAGGMDPNMEAQLNMIAGSYNGNMDVTSPMTYPNNMMNSNMMGANMNPNMMNSNMMMDPNTNPNMMDPNMVMQLNAMQQGLIPMQQPNPSQMGYAQMADQGQIPVQGQVIQSSESTGFRTIPTPTGGSMVSGSVYDGGVEILAGQQQKRFLDLNNSVVRLKEDRITVRRAVRRMVDQVGGGAWNVVWSLSQENATLPDMEISIYTQEPFMNVLNALVARLQARSGQTLRVVRYDNSQKIVITDQQGRLNQNAKESGTRSGVGVGKANANVAITEQVLKDSKVVLHYDEIPLVDALENIVNQASKGQWRLRVYAGMDQVLKPAHIEEPFNIAMERILSLFNLKYEIFPGGKLVVVTSGSAANQTYTNMQQY